MGARAPSSNPINPTTEFGRVQDFRFWSLEISWFRVLDFTVGFRRFLGLKLVGIAGTRHCELPNAGLTLFP